MQFDDGLTGVISFDDEGFRSEFEVDVIEVMGHGFEKVSNLYYIINIPKFMLG